MVHSYSRRSQLVRLLRLALVVGALFDLLWGLSLFERILGPASLELLSHRPEAFYRAAAASLWAMLALLTLWSAYDTTRYDHVVLAAGCGRAAFGFCLAAGLLSAPSGATAATPAVAYGLLGLGQLILRRTVRH